MATGVFIEWGMFKDKSTTLSEKFIYLEIQNLSMLEHGCIASNEHFAEKMGIKKEAVSRLISSLEKKGFITSIIKNGSRNFNRTITINKMLIDPKQNVISPLTNCLETKGNKTTNKTTNSYDSFLNEIKLRVKHKSKVTKTKEGAELFKQIANKQEVIEAYIKHQAENGSYSIRITAFMLDRDAYIQQPKQIVSAGTMTTEAQTALSNFNARLNK